MIINSQSNNSGGRCAIGAFEFDVSSIPDGATVTEVRFTQDASVNDNGVACDAFAMENSSSGYGTGITTGADAITLWDDAIAGNQYADDDVSCAIGSGGLDITFNSLANSDLSADTTGDETFGFSMLSLNPSLNFEREASTNHGIEGFSNGKLFVTYEINEAFNFSPAGQSSTNGGYHQVSVDVPDDDWTLRAKLDITDRSAPSGDTHEFFIVLSDNSDVASTYTTTGDYVGFGDRVGTGTNGYRLFASNDGGNWWDNIQQFSRSATTETLYLSLIHI